MRRIAFLAIVPALLILAVVAYAIGVTSRTQTVNGQPVGQVMVNDQVTMQLTAASGGLSPSDRSAIVAQRLSDVGKLKADDITAEKSGGTWSVLAKGKTLVDVTKADADAANQSEGDLAATWRDALRSGLGGTTVVADTGAGPAADKNAAPAEALVDTDQKTVPIISIGSGLRVGVAVVAGEASQVAKVKVVAQIEGSFKGSARIRALVPIESESIVKNIRRVPGTAVIGLADIKL